MNAYSKILDPALREIDEFARTHEGRKYASEWYEELKVVVERASTTQEDEEAERLLDAIVRSIVDSGPLGNGFAPAINAAGDAMQRRRKQSLKEKKRAEQANAAYRR